MRGKLTPSAISRLGTCLDSAIAEECRTSVSAVTQQRKKRGIPAFHPRREYGSWTDEEIEKLGKTEDADTAGKLGRKKKAVRARRLKMGIPAVRPLSCFEKIRVAVEAQNK